MIHIGVVGAGLAGSLVVMQLVRQAQQPLQISVFEKQRLFQTGVAYAGQDPDHLLNVVAGKMTAFTDLPDDFLAWLLLQPAYQQQPKSLLAQAFMPRIVYGQYLQQRWQQCLQMAADKGIQITQYAEAVSRFSFTPRLQITSADELYTVDALVVATGNELPRHPPALPIALQRQPFYWQNPWDTALQQGLTAQSRVLIIGNGLSMVDTVLTLRKAGVRAPIHSISPHGYGMLPHRSHGISVEAFSSELQQVVASRAGQPGRLLRAVLQLFNRWRKTIRQLGVSAEPLVDALRPYSQLLWQQFSVAEKQLFMRRLRHLWGVARHRVPLHLHDAIQQLRIDGALRVCAGQIKQVRLQGEALLLHYLPAHSNDLQPLELDRIINCTGPEANYQQLSGHPLQQAIACGELAAGPLQLGLAADPHSLALKNAAGAIYPQVFGLGAVLRGELWESTAVHEIRQQAEHIAQQLLALAAAHTAASGGV